MVLGGSAEFLLNVKRPYIYALEFPLIKKKAPDIYGEYLYKIGLTLSTKTAQKRLDSYGTYYAPFSFQLANVLVFPKDTDSKVVNATEKFIFESLKKRSDARPFANTVRLNRAGNKDLHDTREFWEVKSSVLRAVFDLAKAFIKKHYNVVTHIVGSRMLSYSYRLTAKNVPQSIKLTPEEKEANNKKILQVRDEATKFLNTLSPQQRDIWHNPANYFKIDDNYRD
jgi:hypothetical protein